MTDVEMLPCPFCNSADDMVVIHWNGGFTVRCGGCGALGPSPIPPHSHSEAIYNWNKRR